MANLNDLIVWQLAMELSKEADRLAALPAARRDLGMCDQLHRASSSVPSNIAEGYGRNGRKEFARFLDIASGSLRETETVVRKNIGVAWSAADAEPAIKLCIRLTPAIHNLRRYLRNQ
jgi:four helix bundle protein